MKKSASLNDRSIIRDRSLVSVEQSLVVKSANAGPSSRLEGRWYFLQVGMRLYDPRNFRRCETLTRGIKQNELFPRHSFPRSREFFPVSLKGRKTEIGGIIKSGAHLQTSRHRVREMFIRCLREYGKRIDTLHFLRDAPTCFNSTFNRLKATLDVFFRSCFIYIMLFNLI